MDDRQFDQFTRRLGALTPPALPRRGLLGLLGGTMAGSLGLAAGPDLAEARKNNKDKKNKDKNKDKKKKKCKKEGKKCKKNKDCCEDIKCKNDRCGSNASKCSTDARFDDEWGQAGTGNGNFNTPWGITTDPDGFVYVTDTGNERVQAFNRNGGFEGKFGSSGTGTNNFQEPLGIAFVSNSNGDVVFVADPPQSNNNRRLRQFTIDLDDDPIGDFAEDEGVTGLNDPHDIAIDADLQVWVVNRTGRIFLFSRNGTDLADFDPSFSSPNADELGSPEGIAVWKDPSSKRTFVYVADTLANRIVKFEHVSDDPEDGLEYIDEVGSTGSGDRQFNRPTGMAVDKCGNLYIADRFNNRVQVFDKNLDAIDNFSRSFNRPTDVALGPDGDVLYVVDSDNDQIVKFTLE